jgi:hypothetical protein
MDFAETDVFWTGSLSVYKTNFGLPFGLKTCVIYMLEVAENERVVAEASVNGLDILNELGVIQLILGTQPVNRLWL